MPVGECRSADFADINDKNTCIRFSAVQMSKIIGKSQKPKVSLRENVDNSYILPELILLISMINIL